MRKWLLVIGLLVTMTFTAVSYSFAAVDSVDILLKLLVDKKILTEEDASSVRAEVAQIKQDEEAAKKSSNVTSKQPVKLSGYIQEKFSQSPQPAFNNTFDTRRARFVIAGEVIPKLDMNVQVDFAGSKTALTGAKLSGSMLTTSSASFGKPILLDSVIGYKLTPAVKFYAGQMKVPFSLESLTSDSALDTINRTQVEENLVPARANGSQGRDVGMEFAGTVGSTGTNGLDYQIGAFNGAGINVTDDNGRKDLAGRLVYRPGIDGLSVAVAHYNGASGPNGSPHVQHVATGTELVYAFNPWTLKGEYIWSKNGSVDNKGWYATLVNQLGDRTQGVIRYDSLKLAGLTPHNPMNTLTLGLNYFLSKDGYQRVQVNYEIRNDNTVAVPNNLFMTQFQAGF